MTRQRLKGLDLGQLQLFVESLGERKYRAAQLFSWMYARGAASFEAMTDVSKEFRSLLEQVATLQELSLVRKSVSEADGTIKFLFALSDGLHVESVLIPPEPDSPGAERRLTACLSTQVGCPLDCAFCATGTMGFSRNLTTGEIVDQMLQAQSHAPRRISNVVFMGMGEPLLNYENVMAAAHLLTDERAWGIGARRITVSTAGYADRIRQMADEKRKFKLALSLHSLNNEKRIRLMPLTKKFSIDDLLDALSYYYRTTRLRPTFEYILFDGFNDTDDDVQRLVSACRRVPSKINLIPYHSIAFVRPKGLAQSLRPAPRSKIEEFAAALRRHNITVMVRSSSGEDIEAACGQLAVTEQELRQQSDRAHAATRTAATLHT